MASISGGQSSITTLSKDDVDFLGLGLGSWSVSEAPGRHHWSLNERCVFSAIWKFVMKYKSGSQVLLSNSIDKLASAISGDSSVSYKGNPAELVIGGSFLDDGYLGKKVRLYNMNNA